MLKDKDRWEIQALHRDANSIRHIRGITHHDRKTIRNVLTALSPGAAPAGGASGGAIIHNSDYASVEAAKAAMDRYFSERNDHFQKHPRRAGNKL